MQASPDMGALTRAGYRVTARWTWNDVTRAMYCFETSRTANDFVGCVKKRRTDALAVYRYLRDVQSHQGLIYEVLPPAFQGNPEEEEGEGEETCITFVVYDTGYFFLWVDPNQILQDALDANATMRIKYPGAYRVITTPYDLDFSQIAWRPIVPSGEDYVICSNMDRVDFSDAIDRYVRQLKAIMGAIS
ncbi:hypothetical protein a188 [Metallosphaera turreted icosahedral virus]|uniref:hypothetical protein a188 n=1 Tax=Metallosphaera turreted icosahedral virus TaxID=2023155 RepID=UPI000B8D7A66|nr:hypothetical protein a188 [Metallosphaera turreted icosahedral virus]ASO67385.1 hypothetical protein a188 [Metallosphaera turreted icosahedral virus]